MKAWVAIVIVLLLVAGGAAYYFFIYRPNLYLKKFAQLEPDTQRAFITYVNTKGYSLTIADAVPGNKKFEKALVQNYDAFVKMGTQIGDQINSALSQLPF